MTIHNSIKRAVNRIVRSQTLYLSLYGKSSARKEIKIEGNLLAARVISTDGYRKLAFFLVLRVNALALRAFNFSKKGKYIRRKDYHLTRVEVQFSLTSDSVKSPWLATTVNLSSSV